MLSMGCVQGRWSCLVAEQSGGTRMFAAAPKQTLDQYVESAPSPAPHMGGAPIMAIHSWRCAAGIRAQIADSYVDRVDKYDKYVASFGVRILPG